MRALTILLSGGLVLFAAPRSAEAQVCPSGYFWSSYGRRCVRRCPTTHYFSYVEGRCRRRSRRYRRCPTSHYWSYRARRCIRRVVCPTGSYYSYRLRRCQRQRVRCGFGNYYDVYSRSCRRRCPAGWRWSGKRCVSRCSAAFRWSRQRGRCVPRAHGCPAGTFWTGHVCVPNTPPPAQPGYARPRHHPPPSVVARPVAMTSARFAQLRRAVKKATFSTKQLVVLRQAAAGNHFSCAQVASLLRVFSFSSGKIKALRALAPKIVDRKNDFSILGVFTFSSSKRKARKILSRYRSF